MWRIMAVLLYGGTVVCGEVCNMLGGRGPAGPGATCPLIRVGRCSLADASPLQHTH